MAFYKQTTNTTNDYIGRYSNVVINLCR